MTAKPASVRPSTSRTNLGSRGASTGPAAATGARSRAKNSRNTRYSAAIATSHGPAISRLNRVNESPAVANASRLVRLETGSSSDAVFDRCAVAYACGRTGTASVRAVASTTGVSSTMVASRDNTAVVAAASTKT